MSAAMMVPLQASVWPLFLAVVVGTFLLSTAFGWLLFRLAADPDGNVPTDGDRGIRLAGLTGIVLAGAAVVGWLFYGPVADPADFPTLVYVRTVAASSWNLVALALGLAAGYQLARQGTEDPAPSPARAGARDR